MKLTDEEIRAVVAKCLDIPHYSWGIEEERAIADAAMKKAAQEIVDWMDAEVEAAPLEYTAAQLLVHTVDWLLSQGVI